MRRTIDAHMHVHYKMPERIGGVAAQYGYEKFCLLGCPLWDDYLNNIRTLIAKAMNKGRAFAFGGLVHRGNARTADDYARQLDALLGAGFDGLKIIETKPNMMKQVRVPMDDAVYAPLFARCQAERVPVLWHVGDPSAFWDAKRAPQFAIDNGWAYLDGTFPTLEALYAQTERVLARYPDLRVTLAHMYFCGDDLAHAERMMRDFPNVRFDLAPGREMYGQFMQQPDAWRDFFIRYQDRIVYGTDLSDGDSEFEINKNHGRYSLPHACLETDAPFDFLGIQGVGIKLPDDALDKIFATNFERFVGVPEAADIDPAGARRLLNLTEAYLANDSTDAEQADFAILRAQLEHLL